MRAIAIAAIGMTFLGTALYAADTPPIMRGSALIRDVNVQPNDSQLVRAAKTSAAMRARMTVHSARVIDNASLITTGGHAAITTSASAPIPRSSGYETALPSDPTAPANGDQRAAAEKARVEALRQEQAYMAQQEQEPYAEVLDDHVTKRLEALPNEIKMKPPM
jgi:hypothetical protein